MFASIGRFPAVAVALGLLVATWTACALQLLDLDGRVRASAEFRSGVLARRYGNDVGERVSLIDAALTFVAAYAGENGIERAAQLVARSELFGGALGSIGFVDPAGRGLAPGTGGAHSLVPGVRPYVGAALASGVAGLLIAVPSGNGHGMTLPFARVVRGRGGSIAGLVVAEVDPRTFTASFGPNELGVDGTLTIVGKRDRIVRDRFTLSSATGGRSAAASPVWARLALAPEGRYWATSSVDGVQRAYAYRRLAAYPLVVIAGIAYADAAAGYADFRRNVVVAALAVSLLIAIGVAALLYEISLRGKLGVLAHEAHEARAQAEQMRDAMQELAESDALTGLANRRRFDEALETEWRRLARSAGPLSLIMLDLDQFKAFNDTYGHVAGDECLRRIAGVLAQTVRRAPDVAARYGGEEFACVLPGTDLHGAEVIAELIQAAIHAIAIPHAASTVAPYVTASIGVATMICERASLPVNVVQAADFCLYQAKQAGRDRIVAARE